MPVLERVLARFVFNCSTTPDLYTLSLHDALPILVGPVEAVVEARLDGVVVGGEVAGARQRARNFTTDDQDRKSTRLNSSHANISYAVFCLKKKNPNLRLELGLPNK